MNNNITEIIFVLDRSGSMEHLTTETIGGFNSLIKRHQSETEGTVYVTTVLFDDQYELLHNHINIKEVPTLTSKDYYARGCTALLDAVGRTIDNVGLRLAKTPEEDRPGNILFVITTDGYENASQDYTKKRVKEMITLQQDTYNWKFLFLGAKIDAVGEADSIGIRKTMAVSPSATKAGVKSSFGAVSQIADYLIRAPKSSSKKVNDECFEAACCKALSDVE